jgi:hypothetical protein
LAGPFDWWIEQARDADAAASRPSAAALTSEGQERNQHHRDAADAAALAGGEVFDARRPRHDPGKPAAPDGNEGISFHHGTAEVCFVILSVLALRV